MSCLVFYVLDRIKREMIFADIGYILESPKSGFIGFEICSFRWDHLIFFDHYPLKIRENMAQNPRSFRFHEVDLTSVEKEIGKLNNKKL